VTRNVGGNENVSVWAGIQNNTIEIKIMLAQRLVSGRPKTSHGQQNPSAIITSIQ